MDDRAAKLALARKKLKDHQEKKLQDSNHRDGPISDNIKTNQYTATCLEHPDKNAALQEEVNKKDDESFFNTNNQINKEENNAFEVNATEILISNKRNLELQNIALQTKLTEVENNLTNYIQQYNNSCVKIESLENELQYAKQKYEEAMQQLMIKESTIVDLKNTTSSLMEEKSNFKEQFEFTKSILSGKEIENDSLNTQLCNMQSELDGLKLQLQQLTSGVQASDAQKTASNDEMRRENEHLHQKVMNLEQQLKIQNRDYQQINTHYENYVEELNNQIKSLSKKNEDLCKELQNLCDRESSLVEQIGELEIRLQSYSRVVNVVKEPNNEIHEMQEKLTSAQEQILQLQKKNQELQELYAESEATVEELRRIQMAESKHNEVANLAKLNAEITSDKLAAQRATEQNKKLKQDFQGLEDAFVKMTKDKLELTEKITAEKFLNRELTFKLADLDESTKDMKNKLKAKDIEMIRLQGNYRELEKKYEQLESKVKQCDVQVDEPITKSHLEMQNNTVIESCDSLCNHKPENHSEIHTEYSKDNEKDVGKADAMEKLQDRFFKIMGEVADLSDEKHRLEHIITQLQNETDTICEYVALYQQQRSLLKKRDEERSAQIKIFQSECKRLQRHLDELTGILKRFADDKELVAYFENQSKRDDIQRVMSLLANLKTNSLVDPHKTMDFNSFYPCNCCSGQLIEV